MNESLSVAKAMNKGELFQNHGNDACQTAKQLRTISGAAISEKWNDHWC
jgi:hypothetical protein